MTTRTEQLKAEREKIQTKTFTKWFVLLRVFFFFFSNKRKKLTENFIVSVFS